jgi:hypothetical protein
VIYEGKGYDVVTDRRKIGNSFLNDIKKYDRIIMMGHGCPYGLLGYLDVMMDPNVVENLREKECVCIWCNADQYVEREGIKGFYTGMFISEVYEAKHFGIDVSEEVVTYSNNLFSELMRDIIEGENILTEIKETYTGDNPVIEYNNQRLYYKNDNKKKKKKEIKYIL